MTKLPTCAALALILLVSACRGMVLPQPVSTPEPTHTPEPTALPVATDVPGATETHLTTYEGNPVLSGGASDSWDAATVFNGRIVLQGGVYHMFYTGSTSPELETMAIGYATSSDGLSFNRPRTEPILAADGTGFDAVQVGSGVPFVNGETWTLYYNAGSGPGPGNSIGRATALDPSGPWTRGRDPVLVIGGSGEWDAGYVMPDSVLADDEGYVMYYTGGGNWLGGTSMIGMATSPDGIQWTKYDDPTTTESPFTESDPVLSPGHSDSWDSAAVWGCAALRTTDGWEMFYTGSDGRRVQIGYATSTDGIHWVRYEGNPILTSEVDPVAAQAGLSIVQSPSAIREDGNTMLYYDYGVSGGGIGLAIGTLDRP